MQIVPRREGDATRTFIPFEELPPPPVVDVAPQVQQTTGAAHDAVVGKTVTIGNGILATIIIAGMWFDGSKVQTALIVGGVYFALSTGLYIVTVSGVFTAIVNQWQRERTERIRIAAYESLGEQLLELRMIQEQALAERRPPAQSVHRLSPLGESVNYVPPYLDGQQAAEEAVRFATSLYDVNGLPDRRKVHADGRLAVRMPGSKRGGGSKDAGLWLLRNKVIVRVHRGFALNTALFPTIDRVRRLL